LTERLCVAQTNDKLGNIMRIFALFVLSICSAIACADQVGSCDISVTGAVTIHHKSKTLVVPDSASYQQKADAKRVNATADYWLNDSEMRAQLETAASFKLGSKKTPASLKQEVDARMLKDPRLYLVTMSCGDKNLTLMLSPAKESKYANVPFKPGHYVIAQKGATTSSGQFIADLTIGEAPNGDIYRPSAPGTIDIEQFDTKGLAGKFSFTAASFDKTKAIDVSGSFKYTCLGGNCTK
jgi:hypothetical protein